MAGVIADAERDASESFTGGDLPLYDVIRYHLGWADEAFRQVRSDPGKRIRPTICLLSAGAAGDDPERAVPVAAAIELLHNFTLMHDDIQDRSELRRGRPTVWRQWGESQAINAGDATFALSQLALQRLDEPAVEPATIVELQREFNRMTLRIVEGQVLDLGFEDRWDIHVEDYLRMISGKTAAIVAFASWAGARLAGHPGELCARFHQFGRLLGLGFQVRDDYLGIWGDADATGKAPGDDVRRRKKSIPIVMLLDRVDEDERAELRSIYTTSEPGESEVQRVFELLDRYEISRDVQELTDRYHSEALALLNEIAGPSPYRDALQELAEGLVERAK